MPHMQATATDSVFAALNPVISSGSISFITAANNALYI